MRVTNEIEEERKMKKKCLMAAVSALVLASGISLSARAQMREVIINPESVQSAELLEEENIDVLEQEFFEMQDMSEGQDVFEGHDVDETGIVSEEAFAEPEVLENAEIISMEEYLDILGEDAGAEKVITYDLTVGEPEGTVVNLDLRVRGYENYNDYNSTDKKNYYIRVSSKEDFSNYASISRSTGGVTEDGVYVRYARGDFFGVENTTYYAKALVYDSTLKVYVDVCEPKTFTLGETTPIETYTELVNVGAAHVSFEVKAKGIDDDLLSNIIDMEYSKNADFSSSSRNSMYFDRSRTDGYMEALEAIRNLEPETTYYCRLVKYVYGADGYVAIPLSDKVFEITTEANEVYEESRIPDEKLREVILKNTGGVLDKVHLENISSLSYRRSQMDEVSIKDLTGIELLKAVRSITFSYNEIADISMLSQLPILEYAYLEGNNIATIPNLSGVKYLYDLSLESNIIPVKEFNERNTYIPQRVYSYSSSWCSNMAKAQRTSAAPVLVTAGEYYHAGNQVYPLIVQLDNCYGISQYTLSIYEGETVIAEDLQYNKKSADYNWQMFLVEDCVDAPCEKELTFVLKVDGVAQPAISRTVKFTEKLLFTTGTDFYQEPGENYASISGYLYGVNGKVVKMEILDAEGNTIWTDTSVSSSYYESNTDYRYEDIFQSNLTKTARTYFWGTDYADTAWVLGDYDMRFTMEDGTVYLVEDAYHITDKGVITSVDTYPSGYTNSKYSEYAYIYIGGLNMDWTKLWPEVRDTMGNTMSQVVEYKQTGSGYAVYKLKRISGDSWQDDWKVVFAHIADYIVLNADEKATNMNVSYSPDIYYIEHMADSDKVLIVCENMEDGVPYQWTIENYNDSTKTVLGTCTAALENGMAELEFKNADGSKFRFDTSKTISNYRVRCITSGAEVSEYFYNRRYGLDDYIASSYDEIVDSVTPHINDGRSFSETKKLNYEVLTEDMELTATLYDEYGGFVTDKGVVTKAVIYEKFAGVTLKYWLLNISFDGIGWEDGEYYTYEITSGEKSFGDSDIRMLDPEEAYYAIEGETYEAETGKLVVHPTGYFPATMDKSRIGITVRDRDYNVIYKTKVISVGGSGVNAGTLQEKVYLTFDLTEVAEKINEQGGFFYQLTYDRDKICDAYYYDGLQSAYVGDVHDGYIQYSYANNRNMIKGAYRYDNSAMTICIYEPYDTTLLTAINIPAGEEAVYKFTAKDLGALAFNSFDKMYHVVLWDSTGRCMDTVTGYLWVDWPFLDVAQNIDDWKYIGVNYVYNMNVMNGTSATTFNPDGKLTREMQIQILYNLEGAPLVTYKDVFSDVAQGQWYSNAVVWAADTGVTAGMGDGSFGVGKNITREQLAVMLYSYAELKGYDISAEAPIEGFADFAKVSDWSKDALEWAVAMGIMSGKPGNLLDPAGQATRAECATMMRQFGMTYVK